MPITPQEKIERGLCEIADYMASQEWAILVNERLEGSKDQSSVKVDRQRVADGPRSFDWDTSRRDRVEDLSWLEDENF